MLKQEFDPVKQKIRILPLGKLNQKFCIANIGNFWCFLATFIAQKLVVLIDNFYKKLFWPKNGQDGVVDSATALSTLIGLHSSQFKTGFLEIPQMSYLIPTIAPSNKSLRCTRDSVFISVPRRMTVRLVNSKLPRYGNPTYQLLGCLSPYRHPTSWWIFKSLERLKTGFQKLPISKKVSCNKVGWFLPTQQNKPKKMV